MRRAIRAASSSTCATFAAARSGRRPIIRRAASPTTTPSTFLAGSRDVPTPRRRGLDAARDRGVDGTRRRGAAAARSSTTASASARSTSPATPRSCSRSPARRLRASGVRQAVHRDRIPRRQRRAALPSAAARPRDPGTWAVHVAQPRGPRRTARSNGKPIARASSAAAATPTTRSRSTAAPLSGTTGFVLDPILSLRQRVRLPAGGSVRLCFATGVAPGSRDRRSARAELSRSERGRARVLAGLRRTRIAVSRHMNISNDDAVLFERLASRVLGAEGSLRAERRRRSRRTSSARPACGRTAFPATCRSCSSASSATTTSRSSGRRWRRRSTGA